MDCKLYKLQEYLQNCLPWKWWGGAFKVKEETSTRIFVKTKNAVSSKKMMGFPPGKFKNQGNL